MTMAKTLEPKRRTRAHRKRASRRFVYPSFKPRGPRLTAESPTEPGLYWYQLQGSQVIRNCRVEWFAKHEGDTPILCCPAADGQLHAAAPRLRLWAGPLLEPIGGLVQKRVDVEAARRKEKR